MEENPVLEVHEEEEPDFPPAEEDAAPAEPPDAPSEDERELVIDEKHSNEDDFERLMNMDEQWPNHFEERSHSSRRVRRSRPAQKLDAMANAVARPQSLQDYLSDQLGWFDLAPEIRPLADRIIANLDTNGYLQGRLEDLLGERPAKEEIELAQGPGAGAEARSAGRRHPDLRECLLLQLTGHAPLRRIEDPDFRPPGSIWSTTACRSSPERPAIPSNASSKCSSQLRELHPKPAPISRRFGPAGHARRVRRAERKGRYRVRPEDSQTPNLYISRYYRQTASKHADQRRNAPIHQAKGELGPVADRLDQQAADR